MWGPKLDPQGHPGSPLLYSVINWCNGDGGLPSRTCDDRTAAPMALNTLLAHKSYLSAGERADHCLRRACRQKADLPWIEHGHRTGVEWTFRQRRRSLKRTWRNAWVVTYTRRAGAKQRICWTSRCNSHHHCRRARSHCHGTRRYMDTKWQWTR